mmetsp:Transcript_146206/g.364576  ORF Transcript_146206/g.364576 Transcript_146206/m.364576 type:complete len:245 (+) Transcript_146206:95-829(+)
MGAGKTQKVAVGCNQILVHGVCAGDKMSEGWEEPVLSLSVGLVLALTFHPWRLGPRHVAVAVPRVHPWVVVALALALAFRFALALPLHEAWDVCPLLDDLQLPATKEGAVEQQGVLDALLVRELDVCEALRAARVLVDQDGNAVDLPTRLEVLLQLLWSRAIVHIPHIHRPPVDLLAVQAVGGLLDCLGELLQFLGLLLHLLDLPLHLLDLGIGRAELTCRRICRVLRHGWLSGWAQARPNQNG